MSFLIGTIDHSLDPASLKLAPSPPIVGFTGTRTTEKYSDHSPFALPFIIIFKKKVTSSLVHALL